MTNDLTQIRNTFDRLIRGDQALGPLDRKIMDAIERIMEGRPASTDGVVSITNICAEAAISRASYYRSPVAPLMRQLLNAPDTVLPETERLRRNLHQLTRENRQLRRDQASEVRELRDTIKNYANQIQVLALRNAELTADNERLLTGLAHHEPDITQLHPHAPAT